MIRPRPGGGLTWAKADYDSVHGPVSSHWKMEGDDFKLEVAIPANTSATVYIPAAKQSDVTEGGQLAEKSTGVKFVKMDSGAAVFEIGSGNYAFSSKNAKSIIESSKAAN